MAEWWGSSRSNRFKVKDKAAFKSWLPEVSEVSILDEKDDYIAIAGDCFGAWPTSRGEEAEDFDYVGELSGFLAEDEIAVLIEAGAEKLRYIMGTAVAVNSRGQRVKINLSSIYAEAEAVLGRRPQPAEY